MKKSNPETSIIEWTDRKHHLWFPFSFRKYCIRNDRLIVEKGIFASIVDEVLLYRIVDITLIQTLAGRLFGTGTVILHTTVDTEPEIRLENIKHPRKVREQISILVEESRTRRNVVGTEFFTRQRHVDADGDGFCDTHNPS